MKSLRLGDGIPRLSAFNVVCSHAVVLSSCSVYVRICSVSRSSMSIVVCGVERQPQVTLEGDAADCSVRVTTV